MTFEVSNLTEKVSLRSMVTTIFHYSNRKWPKRRHFQKWWRKSESQHIIEVRTCRIWFYRFWGSLSTDTTIKLTNKNFLLQETLVFYTNKPLTTHAMQEPARTDCHLV